MSNSNKKIDFESSLKELESIVTKLEDENINLEDTSSVLSNYIDSLETEVDKEKVKTFMKSLYTEAINRDVI